MNVCGIVYSYQSKIPYKTSHPSRIHGSLWYLLELKGDTLVSFTTSWFFIALEAILTIIDRELDRLYNLPTESVLVAILVSVTVYLHVHRRDIIGTLRVLRAIANEAFDSIACLNGKAALFD